MSDQLLLYIETLGRGEYVTAHDLSSIIGANYLTTKDVLNTLANKEKIAKRVRDKVIEYGKIDRTVHEAWLKFVTMAHAGMR